MINCKHSVTGNYCHSCKEQAHMERVSAHYKQRKATASEQHAALMLLYERAEWNRPGSYHTGNELAELFSFFDDVEYFGPKEAMKYGDIHESVNNTLLDAEETGMLLDIHTVY